MSAAKKLGAVVGVALSGLYLMNLGAGILELGPDNAPMVGNLDEIVATIVLLRCLGALGINTARWVGPRSPLAALRGIGAALPTDQPNDGSKSSR